jgi:hypothetical protein
MTPPQMSGAAPAAVLGRAHANGSCQELRPTHTLGHNRPPAADQTGRSFPDRLAFAATHLVAGMRRIIAR